MEHYNGMRTSLLKMEMLCKSNCATKDNSMKMDYFMDVVDQLMSMDNTKVNFTKGRNMGEGNLIFFRESSMKEIMITISEKEMAHYILKLESLLLVVKLEMDYRMGKVSFTTTLETKLIQYGLMDSIKDYFRKIE